MPIPVSEMRRRDLAAEVARTLSLVGASATADDAFEALLRGAMRLLGGDAGVLRVLDQQTGEVILRLDLESDGELSVIRERRPVLPGSTVAALAAGGQPILIDDYASLDKDAYPYFDRMLRRGLHASVNIAIDAGTQRIGTLHVNSRRPAFFGTEELAIAEALASQAGRVIERAQLVEAERTHMLARLDLEARYRALLELAPDAVITLDEERRITLVNRRGEEVFGYRQDELLGRSLTLILPERSGAELPDALDLRSPTDAPQLPGQVQEYTGRRKDGTEFPIELSWSTWRAEDSMITIGIARDVSDHKRAEAVLRQREQSLSVQFRAADVARSETRAVLDATEEAMWLLAPDGRVLIANQRVEGLLGLPVGNLIGRTLTDLQAEGQPVFEDPTLLQTLIDLVTDPSRQVMQSIRQRWPQERELALYSAPVHAADGELLGRLFAFRDVTRERAADRAKTEFVSHVSHELRTPLTSIKGYVDLLLGGEVGELSLDQREFLEIIQRNANREVALVNNLLDLSRLEAGQMELQRTSLALPPLLREVANAFRPLLDAKQQRLTLGVAADLPPVLGDAERLTQVFTNLVSNAHKYTPAGAIITVSVVAQDGELRVDVRDTGIGLTPEEQARIFTRFYRAENRTTREVGGTGLGLAITRALVERHGGTITVTSVAGKGSTFSVALPCHATPIFGQPSQDGNRCEEPAEFKSRRPGGAG